MNKLVLCLMVLTFALPCVAQTPEPLPPTPEPAPVPVPPAPSPAEAPPKKSWFKQHVFFGGGVGAGFGTVDYFEIAPMVGLHVIPRVDLGLQPFYQWTDDGRYSPSISTSDYGARLFTRVRIWGGLFAEADYEYTNYEFPTSASSTTRESYNAYLVGGGYYFGFGGRVSMYASALYDLNYDSDDPFRPYDSAIRYGVGVAVGF